MESEYWLSQMQRRMTYSSYTVKIYFLGKIKPAEQVGQDISSLSYMTQN